MKVSIWKWLVLILVTAASLYLAVPTDEKVKLGLDLQGGSSYTLEVQEDENLEGPIDEARDQAIEVIRNRIDGMGIAEPSIYPDGDRRIVVQIPGMSAEDRARASESIRRPAQLTFRVVAEQNSAWVNELFDSEKTPENYRLVTVSDRRLWERTVKNPPDYAERQAIAAFAPRHHAQFDLMLEPEVIGSKTYYRPWYVSRKPELTGDMLTSASVGFDERGERSVDLAFNGEGRRLFAKVTRDLAPNGAKNHSPDGWRYLAIVLDDVLYSAPRVKDEIVGGRASITGNFTLEEAADLANALQIGRAHV